LNGAFGAVSQLAAIADGTSYGKTAVHARVADAADRLVIGERSFTDRSYTPIVNCAAGAVRRRIGRSIGAGGRRRPYCR
jgi:hypothetical protein